MEKKYALVTGASRGIGTGIAESLAKDGYGLCLICRNNEDQLNAFAGHLHKTYGVEVMTLRGNVGNEFFVQEVRKNVEEVFGSLDVLVNNAGIWRGGLLTDMTLSTWNELIETNLTGTFLITRAFVPMMVSKKSGQIINISSVWGIKGASCEAAYSATKGGVNAFTTALAKELGPSGIRVNAIAPGVIDTDMNAGYSEEEMDKIIEDIPLGAMGNPEDIGKALMGIINTPYITGQIITVDGGYL